MAARAGGLRNRAAACAHKKRRPPALAASRSPHARTRGRPCVSAAPLSGGNARIAGRPFRGRACGFVPEPLLAGAHATGCKPAASLLGARPWCACNSSPLWCSGRLASWRVQGHPFYHLLVPPPLRALPWPGEFDHRLAAI
eukprot:1393975-Prymnesium_polylepis.1